MHVIKTRTNSVATTSPIETLDPPDHFVARIRKLVPAEAIAVYTVVVALSTAIPTASAITIPAAIAAGSLAITLALRRASFDRDSPPLQYIFALAAYWAWAFAIHDPLGVTPPAVAACACIVLPVIGSMAIGLVEN